MTGVFTRIFSRRCFPLMLLLGLTGLSVATSHASPRLRAEVAPDRARVGDTVTLTLHYVLPKGATVTARSPVAGLEEMTLTAPPKMQTGGKDPHGGNRGKVRLKLLIDRVQDVEIGPLTLTYETEDGQSRTLKTAPVTLRVVSNLNSEPEAAQLTPIYGIIPTRLSWLGYMPWAIGTVLAGAMGGLLLYWYKRRRRRRLSGAPDPPAHTLAQQQLRALEQAQHFEPGQVKMFYFRFSEILRHYLKALRGFPAAEYTTEEIAHVIHRPEDRAVLQLLREADQVKFADVVPTRARQQEAVNTARSYIRQTGTVFDTPPARPGPSRGHGRDPAHPQGAGS